MTNLRKTTVQRKKKIILITLILMLSVCIKPHVILGEEKNVVKVGYANVPGFTEVKDGVYTGYAYEYLVEMAKLNIQVGNMNSLK